MSGTGTPPAAAVVDPADALRKQLAAAAADLAQAKQAAGGSGPIREADRSAIAHRIVWIFTGAIGAVLLLYVIQAYQSTQWSMAASEAADLIKSVLLPVVTLILGYYFGQSDKS